MATDYQPINQPLPEHEVVKRNGKVIFPPELAAAKEEVTETVDELLINEAALEGFRLNDGQRFILAHVISGSPKRIVRKDVFEKDYNSHKSESARGNSFAADMKKLEDILEKIAGQPVFARRGRRGGTYYEQLMAVRTELDDLSDSEQEGEVDLKRTGTEAVTKIKRPKPEAKPSMTSKEFWNSPIPTPKPTMHSKIVRKTKKPGPPLPPIIETRRETIDGREWKVQVLDGYTGQAPRPTTRRVRSRHQRTINSSLGID